MWTQLRYGNSGLRPADGVDPLANTHGARFAQQMDSGFYEDPQSYQRYAEGILSGDPPEVPTTRGGLNRDWGRRRLTAQYEGTPSPNHYGMIYSDVHTDQRPSHIYNKEREFDARWSKFQKLGDNLLADQVPVGTARERIEAERFNPLNIRLPEDDKVASPLGFGAPFRGGAALSALADHHGAHTRNSLMLDAITRTPPDSRHTRRPNQTRGPVHVGPREQADPDDYHLEDEGFTGRSAAYGRPTARGQLADKHVAEPLHDPSTSLQAHSRNVHANPSAPRAVSDGNVTSDESLEHTRAQYARIAARTLGLDPLARDRPDLHDERVVRVVDSRPHHNKRVAGGVNEHQPASGELSMSGRMPSKRGSHQPSTRLTVSEQERHFESEHGASARLRTADSPLAGYKALSGRRDEGMSGATAQELASHSRGQKAVGGHRVVQAEGGDGLLLAFADGRLVKYKPQTLAQLAADRPTEAEHRPLFSRRQGGSTASQKTQHRLTNTHVTGASDAGVDVIERESFVTIPHAYEPGKIDTHNLTEVEDESCMRSRVRAANYRAAAALAPTYEFNDASEIQA